MYNHEQRLLAQAIFHEQFGPAEENGRRQHRRPHGRRLMNTIGAAAGNLLIAAGRRLQSLDSVQSAPATLQ